jgi:hypothetical protein
MGRGFDEAVRLNIDEAVVDAESEGMCDLSPHLFRQKFGKVPTSGICRETASSEEGGRRGSNRWRRRGGEVVDVFLDPARCVA